MSCFERMPRPERDCCRSSSGPHARTINTPNHVHPRNNFQSELRELRPLQLRLLQLRELRLLQLLERRRSSSSELRRRAWSSFFWECEGSSEDSRPKSLCHESVSKSKFSVCFYTSKLKQTARCVALVRPEKVLHPFGSLISATIDTFISLGAPCIGGSMMYHRFCELKDCWVCLPSVNPGAIVVDALQVADQLYTSIMPSEYL